MPLPLGHATIGLAVHSLLRSSESGRTSWGTLAFVVFLANLPDIDILIGLIIEGNGNVFHRGPTHSLLFAFVMGLLASNAWRFWSVVPKLSFLWGFLLVLSHVVADAVFTTSPVSLLWPLQVNWSVGHSGWTDVIASVSLGAYKDAGIVLGFGLLMVINELFRPKVSPFMAMLSRIRYIARILLRNPLSFNYIVPDASDHRYKDCVVEIKPQEYKGGEAAPRDPRVPDTDHHPGIY